MQRLRHQVKFYYFGMNRSNRFSRFQVKLFKFAHEPGSGATTIAMNVLWNLRNDFRCVRIDALDASAIADVAEQITG